MALPENGGGSGFVPVDGQLWRAPGYVEVWLYFQGRLFLVANATVAVQIWGVNWPTLIVTVSPDWVRTLTRGRDVDSVDTYNAIYAGNWQPPAPTPEDPDWQPAPDDPDEDSYSFFGESILSTIQHEAQVLSQAVGRGIPNLVGRAKDYRLELRKIRKDWG